MASPSSSLTPLMDHRGGLGVRAGQRTNRQGLLGWFKEGPGAGSPGAKAAMIGLLLISGAVTLFPDAGRAYTPHNPVIIVGNAFSSFATGGDGTSGNPWIIEGWEIDASLITGLQIYNTDDYFVIRDAYIHSGGAQNDGLLLSNVTHGRLERVRLEDNRYGARVLGSTDIAVVESAFVNNTELGVLLDKSVDVVMANNTFWGDGLFIQGDLMSHYDSHTIPQDNLVNGRPLLYSARTAVSLNGDPVGQVIVVGAPVSLIHA